MALETSHWPWWMGALALGGIAVGHWLLVGKLLGVSGVFLKLVKARSERRAARAEAAFLEDPALLEAALMEATLAAMGDAPELQAPAIGADGIADRAPVCEAPGLEQEAAPTEARPETIEAPRTPLSAYLAFVLALAAGGALAAALGGQHKQALGLGEAFTRIWGGGWSGLAVLLAGGILVGFGTCLAGGCTSGHGLSGCSRLQPGSLVATAAFFGTGVLVSLAMARWLA